MAENTQQPAVPPTFNITATYRSRFPYRETPFDSSAIEYHPFIAQLTRLLETLDQGAVIAIDAPWGSGKSYFAQNYVESLKRQNWTVSYIDAFEADYVEDPFMLLASAIPFKKSLTAKNKNYLKAAAKAGKAILPIAAKAAIKIVTANVLNADDLEKSIAEGMGEATEKIIQSKIEDFQKEHSSFATFRDQLTAIAHSAKESTGKPLVIFIDELDRCRPDFAVRTLERIKHLFAVPDLSFVLLLHTSQLEYAVKGLYGDIDARSYLRKFIHFTLPLPRNENEPGQPSEVAQYASYLGSQINFGPAQNELNMFIQGLQYIAPSIDMSFRDVERAILDFVVRDISRGMYPLLVVCLTNLICLKIMRRDLYNGVRARDKPLSEQAIDFFKKAAARGCPDDCLPLMEIVIGSHTSGDISPDHRKAWYERVGRGMAHGPSPERIFKILDKD